MTQNAMSTSRLVDRSPHQATVDRADAELIQRLSTECGCRAGAIALFAAAAAFVFYQFQSGAGTSRPHVAWVWGVPVACVASITAKMLSIGAARLRLRFLYRRIGAPLHTR